MKIVGIGKTNVDLVYSGLPRLIGEGEELYSEGFEILLGGGYPATLAHLRKLGEQTSFITYLGKDMFSSFAKAELEAKGIEVTNVYEGDKIPVNVSTVMITPEDRSIATYTTAYHSTAESEAEVYNASKGADVVLMEALEHLDVYKKLKAEGAILVFDTGWDDELTMDKYGDYVKLADYYTPNSKEAVKLTGKATPEEALDELSKYFKKAVVKLDKRGALGKEGDKTVFVKSIPEFKGIDSTGAGDNFLAGFVYGIVKGYDIENALLCGNITGGKCVTEIGCFRGQVDYTEIELLRNKYQGLIVR